MKLTPGTYFTMPANRFTIGTDECEISVLVLAVHDGMCFILHHYERTSAVWLPLHEVRRWYGLMCTTRMT